MAKDAHTWKIEVSGCLGKKAYETKVEAIRIRDRMVSRRSSKKAWKKIAPYLCEICGKFHLGNSTSRAEKF